MDQNNLRILIAGDFYPSKECESSFRTQPSKYLFGDLEKYFECADLSIINLETPLSEKLNPIKKHGPNLISHPDILNALKKLGVSLVNLANNHTMDHGDAGLISTLSALSKYEMSYLGAGRTVSEASVPFIKEIKGKQVVVLAFAESEFGIASETQFGVNGYAEIDLFRQINAIKSHADCIVVIIHGGNEEFAFPRPGMVKLSRFLAEIGANAVIWQHSHWVGSYERYKNCPIIYGQGNFVFNIRNKVKEWYEGMLVSLSWNEKARFFDADFIPFKQSFHAPFVRELDENEANKFIKELELRSCIVQDYNKHQEVWSRFCLSRYNGYLNAVSGNSNYVRRFLRKLGVKDRLTDQLARLNMIECESHREALIHCLKISLDKI